jgi:hypothetical protein
MQATGPPHLRWPCTRANGNWLSTTGETSHR